MKIAASQLGFASQHDKYVTQAQLGISKEVGAGPNSGVGRQLDYDARMSAAKTTAVNATSDVVTQGKLDRHQQAVNTASLVSTVIGRDVTINTEQPNGFLPLQENARPLVGAQTYENLQALELNVDESGTLTELQRWERRQTQPARVQVEDIHIYHEHEYLNVAAQGQITTADGREITFALDLEMERSFDLEERLVETRDARRLIDPLVINLQGGVAGLTHSSFAFDLDADGVEEEISFVGSGSGFLALDSNQDGQINDGSELFGTQGTDGFSDLARFDSDNNRWIDENDPIFAELKIWTRDAEGNDQLVGLKEAGVGAIYLGSTASTFDLTDDQNNLLGQVKRSGVFLMEDGAVGSIQELDLAIHEAQAAPKNAVLNRELDQRIEGPALAEADRLPSFIELMLPADDRLPPARREIREQRTEVTERITSNSVQRSESGNEEAEEERFFFIDSERLDVLTRLREQTESEFNPQADQDSYSFLRAIIETLKTQREQLEAETDQALDRL
ncbi:hypothetical protein [Neptunomonas marina]|uniref:VCBS repeat-containing protein n=1 Tax=Neptunomonas marina TaxID=1815562 RepID=A0A437QBH4_9GAMM|nr:hypothetical protein [Neptunomonas marina]RVU31693.1 hypothetical protein EOE65_06870 [Neptunomonas marina]